ncbi:MAG: peptidylprolyl isomerase [Myxococcota bacterium]
MRWLTLAAVLVLSACSGDDSDATDGSDTTDGTDWTDATDDTDGAESTRVRMETSLGVMLIEVDVENAPITANNFLSYVDSGFFDGDDGLGATVFHRVIKDFVIQGGGFVEDGERKTTLAPIELESDTGLKNLRGTLSMARTNAPNSATTQFFVNHKDNANLDPTGPGTGYAVFAKVVEGLDVLDAIATTPVDATDPNFPKPLTAVVITDCERVD